RSAHHPCALTPDPHVCERWRTPHGSPALNPPSRPLPRPPLPPRPCHATPLISFIAQLWNAGLRDRTSHPSTRASARADRTTARLRRRYLLDARQPGPAASGVADERRHLRRRRSGRARGTEPSHHQPAPEQTAPGRDRLGSPRGPPQLLHRRGPARAETGRADLRAHRARRILGPRSADGSPLSMTASPNGSPAAGPRMDLTRYAWLSIFTAIVTITLKTSAWALTGSVGLLSDAAESTVNLVAAAVALIALKVAARPASERFLYGPAKAEYFSAAVEGAMIVRAGAAGLRASVGRFIEPRPTEITGAVVAFIVAASVLSGLVALVLIRVGRRHRSSTLRADGKHLMTDVVTSAGVLLGVGLVVVTGGEGLDALVAFAIGVNIIVTALGLSTEAVSRLREKAL